HANEQPQALPFRPDEGLNRDIVWNLVRRQDAHPREEANGDKRQKSCKKRAAEHLRVLPGDCILAPFAGPLPRGVCAAGCLIGGRMRSQRHLLIAGAFVTLLTARSEEHTSELQSPYDLVCRLLLEKKK